MRKYTLQLNFENFFNDPLFWPFLGILPQEEGGNKILGLGGYLFWPRFGGKHQIGGHWSVDISGQGIFDHLM